MKKFTLISYDGKINGLLSEGENYSEILFRHYLMAANFGKTINKCMHMLISTLVKNSLIT